MKKILITLALIMASISVAVGADINFKPYNIQIQNTGDRNLYVAVSSVPDSYTNILGMSVNGKTVKQDVWQLVAPFKIVYLILQPEQDFNNYISSYYIYQKFSFGLTKQAAQYNFDNVYIDVTYNSSPLRYNFASSGNPITTKIINSNTIQYDVNSDASVFVY